MANENFDIVLRVTSQDLEKVYSLLNDIAEMSHEVENIDLGKNIERSARGAAKALDDWAKSSERATKATREQSKAEQESARALSTALKLREGSIKAQDRMDKMVGGRNYRNISTSVDDYIELETKARKDLSNQLKADIINRNNERIAQEKSNQTIDETVANLPRLRYALYDVSSAFAVVGAAATAMSAGIYAVSISMERDFADVIRTVGGDATQLRQDFEELFTSMPVSWSALSEIGTLAGQLNIAAEDVREFTSLVAQFSATTDVSVEQSATAFGRLAQLLGVAGEDYERLGSSILMVGVNSVATESQIIAISTQIAGIARQANLSADEVFGLAASFASLGVQPELTRGTVTRLFSQIEMAIAGGGNALDRFASISGRAANDFSGSWGSDSAGVLQDFLRGLGAIEARGGSATQALRELGITSVRDVPALLRLAQSADLVAANFDLAAQGWRENSELAAQYGVIADTTASRLEVLSNNFANLMGTLGSASTSPVIKAFIDGLSNILHFMDRIASNSIGSVFAAIGVALLGLVGILGLITAGIIRSTASALGMRTAMNELGLQGAGLGAIFRALTASISGTTVAVNASTAALNTNNAAMGNNAVATGNAANAGGRLTRILGRGGIVGSLLLAIPLLFELGNAAADAFGDWQREINGTNDRIKEMLDLLDSGYSDRNFEEFVTAQKVAIEESSAAIADWVSQVEAVADLGANQMILDTVMGDIPGIAEVDEALAAFAKVSIPAARTAYADYIDMVVEKTGLKREAIVAMLPATQEALRDEATALEQSADAWSDYVEGLESSIDAILGPVQDMYNISDAIENIGETTFNAGLDSSQGFGAIVEGIDAVVAASPENAANNLAAFYEFLINGAGVSADSLIQLSQIVVALGGDAARASIDFTQFGVSFDRGARSVNRVSSAARSAQKEIRTLTDYANDLAKVWNRAFNIRFGSQAALDNISNSWRDLNDEMDEYRRKVSSLTADRDIKAYWLEVAETFGHTLRANQLRAEIADMDAEIADATAKGSTELEGNSKAAAINRDRITDMVKSYQDYIEELADAGADQETLNQAINRSESEFRAQADALGYSEKQVQFYIQGFRDMRVAVNNVPRNVTVDMGANKDPADLALRELQAQINKTTNNGKGYSIPITTTTQTNNAALIRTIQAQIDLAIANMNRGGYSTAAANYIGGLQKALRNARGWAEGGYTGAGGKYQPAGLVHRGEYVIPQEGVNQSTGLPYMSYVASLNNATRAPQASYANGGYVTGGMTIATIDPNQMRQLLAALDNPIGVLADDTLIARKASRGSAELSRQGVIL